MQLNICSDKIASIKEGVADFFRSSLLAVLGRILNKYSSFHGLKEFKTMITRSSY